MSKSEYLVVHILTLSPFPRSGQEEITQLGEIKTRRESMIVSYCEAQNTEQWCGQTLCLLNWSAENQKPPKLSVPSC